jgi:hypothetical protein
MSSVYSFYLLRSNFSHFFIGWLAIFLTHIYIFSIPCILIGYHLLGGSFLSRCTVFQHNLSLIALLHHHLYHFYLLRRIFVGIILLPRETTTISLLDPLTFARSHWVQ